jgi:ribosome-associated protein
MMTSSSPNASNALLAQLTPQLEAALCPNTLPNTSLEWLAWAAFLAADRQADEVQVMEVGHVSGVTEAFLLCTAHSKPQVRAVADLVELAFKLAGQPPLSVERDEALSWVLLDYGHVMVHVMQEEARAHYNLERLWSHGDPVPASALQALWQQLGLQAATA